MKLVIGCALLGLAAFQLARGCGIPAWTTWTPGDATDIGVCVGFGALAIAQWVRS